MKDYLPIIGEIDGSVDIKNDSVIDVTKTLNIVLEPKYKEETKKDD